MTGYCGTCRTATRSGHASTAKHRAAVRPALSSSRVSRPQLNNEVTERARQVEHYRSQVADSFLARLASTDDGAMVADEITAVFCGAGWSAEPITVAPTTTPTPNRPSQTVTARHRTGGGVCPRCAQSFRTPKGRAWHIANRPQCKREKVAA